MPSDIASAIRAFRERHGLTRRECAAILGLPEKSGGVQIARWETGERGMSRATAENIERRMAKHEAREAA